MLKTTAVSTSRERERTIFAQSFDRYLLKITVDRQASKTLEVAVMRDILQLGDEAVYGHEWKLHLHGTSALLKNYLIAVSNDFKTTYKTH